MIRIAMILTACLLMPLTVSAVEWADVPAGPFLMGSTPAQVEQGYRISAAGYGHDRVRQSHWFDDEAPQRQVNLPAYRIMTTPVTQAEYAVFIQQSGHPAPFVDADTWASYGLIEPYADVMPLLWHDGKMPEGMANHPVVLVSYADARAYAAWLSKRSGRSLRLPSEAEWEKAMRGVDGRLYPWGNAYDAARLNDAARKLHASMPVGALPDGASPYGVLDGAGQVFEWTTTPWSGDDGKMTVKGGSWDDYGGVCRVAAHHERPRMQKHFLIGFRLMEDLTSTGLGSR
ncbi:MAG: hypothetical protein COW18_01305 [Zetaproteobacteria bacterium CG12_big_fil_rev_8_21_14_0_65_54_13]|nr:MAG: hypothetical protein COW18_01305 [Zetaproteobacteria bacterium CG12_big_fil_rev_8_21_14_0_65_54_13]PIX54888.1 MAG: hypothetical protein COZ50_05670 [Zetaproteobacteria bacterium CG_4_10_14_3_um_filter_54_28]PJA30355.1 MAG: hypothetical protein CO188_03945 [Zetaproteobacteria bacterium CG_4_9_14_3_um_filter_54_145]